MTGILFRIYEVYEVSTCDRKAYLLSIKIIDILTINMSIIE